MIKIQDVVKDIVDKNIEIKNAMAKGFVNLSRYAKDIKGQVDELTKKEVSEQSIVVALSRVAKKIKSYAYMPEIEISQLSVKTPVTELVYANNVENQKKLSTVAKLVSSVNDVFLTISTSSTDISIVFSSSLRDKVKKSFTKKPKVEKANLSVVSVRFDSGLTEQSGVGFSLLQKVASRNIVLEEVVSTYNEFTLVFKTEYLSDVLLVLK